MSATPAPAPASTASSGRRRQDQAVFVPRHRRLQAEQPDQPPSTPDPEPTSLRVPEADVDRPASASPSSRPASWRQPRGAGGNANGADAKKRGRGNFRAPVSATTGQGGQQQKMDQMARVYPDKPSPRSGSSGGAKGGSGESTSKKSPTRQSRRSPRRGSGAATAETRPDAEGGVDDGEGAVGIPSPPTSEGDVVDEGRVNGEKAGAEEIATADEEEGEWEKADDESLAIPVSEVEATAKVEKAKQVTMKEAKVVPKKEVDDGPTRALEVYDFDAAFKTQDIHSIYSDFQGDGFTRLYKLKWMTDTSAVLVFDSVKVAKQAYVKTMDSKVLKVRPWSGKVPDGDNADEARPVKTDKVARRLIAGALGVRAPKKTAEEVEIERRKFQLAKDIKEAEKLAQSRREKEIEAAWDE
ncbi:Coiled-coil domain-containing protein r3hcc1l [Irineochytrium annulatum]|nr:Coiled-coil domain-containing protein r3hcc1l [Irineochytrium annulatum]